MTVFERTARFGDGETGAEVCRKSRKMPGYFADSPIPATSMARLKSRNIELNGA
jgi:hypothetical protein